MMRSVILASTTAAFALLSLSGTAAAQQTTATAVTDLNIRSGPGPDHEVVGVIGADEEATLHGCLDDSKWCQVTHDDIEGWSYSDYLVGTFEGADQAVVLSEWPEPARPEVTYEVTTVTTTTAPAENEARDGEGGAVAGATAGALAGALIAGPVGAAVGGVVGAGVGGTMEDAVDPPPEVVTYVQTNPVEPVFLEGEVVVGAGLPETVEIREIPDSEFDYVYVNRLPVLVDEDRRIVAVLR